MKENKEWLDKLRDLPAEEYRKQMLGEWLPDKRLEALYQRLEKYYKDTPDSMSNRNAMPYWLEFRKWCDRNGYTQEEINRAKMNVKCD